jgi:hypothetical protein
LSNLNRIVENKSIMSQYDVETTGTKIVEDLGAHATNKIGKFYSRAVEIVAVGNRI